MWTFDMTITMAEQVLGAQSLSTAMEERKGELLSLAGTPVSLECCREPSGPKIIWVEYPPVSCD